MWIENSCVDGCCRCRFPYFFFFALHIFCLFSFYSRMWLWSIPIRNIGKKTTNNCFENATNGKYHLLLFFVMLPWQITYNSFGFHGEVDVYHIPQSKFENWGPFYGLINKFILFRNLGDSLTFSFDNFWWKKKQLKNSLPFICSFVSRLMKGSYVATQR